MVEFKRQDLILNFDRIRADVTDFIRGNPITTAAIALGVPATFLGIAAVGRRVAVSRKSRKKKKTLTKKKNGRRKRKVVGRRIVRRRRKKVSHASPRHKGHKRVSFTTASGQKVSFLVRKKGSPSHRIKRRKK